MLSGNADRHTSDIGHWFAMTKTDFVDSLSPRRMAGAPEFRILKKLGSDNRPLVDHASVHFHSVTSGRSTPYSAMYCLCSTSLSFICWTR